MRKAIVVLLGALGLVACSREKQPLESPGITSVRGAEQGQRTASVEEVRTLLLEKRPGSAEEIKRLTIASQGGIITLTGKVQDEATHSDLINQVRAMPNVRGVRDEIHVGKKVAAGHPEHGGEYGTTTTTGGAMPPPQQQPSPQQLQQQEQHQHQHQQAHEQKDSKSDAVRKSLEKAHPKSESIIHGLTITDDGENVTLSGKVPDEATHRSLVKTAKETPGVKSVKDELKVEHHHKK